MNQYADIVELVGETWIIHCFICAQRIKTGHHIAEGRPEIGGLARQHDSIQCITCGTLFFHHMFGRIFLQHVLCIFHMHF